MSFLRFYQSEESDEMDYIKTEKLTKHYGKNRGIEDIDVNVKKGEIFGFIGPNGAGKSTLIRTLLNFLYPTSGSATILGKDIVKNSKEIKEDIGYVPSEVKYYEKVTVREIIDYAKSFTKHSYTDKEIDFIIKDLDIDLDKKMEELSLGNKKKVALVQALINNPKILILDEPTSGLDPLIQIKLFKLLRKIKDSGSTVFFSSHNLAEVESICDRVLIIREGRVVKLVDLKETIKDLGKIIEVSGVFPKIVIEEMAERMIFADDKKFKFIYKGDIDKFIKTMSHYDIEELSVRPESLEDTFMKYYEQEVKQ